LKLETGKDQGKRKGEAHNTGKLENPAVIKFNLILVVFITVGLITKGTSLKKPLLSRLACSNEEFRKSRCTARKKPLLCWYKQILDLLG
jgi:hypothetical protein